MVQLAATVLIKKDRRSERCEVMAIMNPYNYSRPAGVQVEVKKATDMSNQEISQAGKSKSDAYLEQKIMNARPEELTLMLYDGLIKFVKQAQLFNEQKVLDKSNNANLRAQAIIQELRSSLNMDIEMSENLENLYLFMLDRLVDANITKSNETLQDILDLASDLRDAWKEAMNL